MTGDAGAEKAARGGARRPLHIALIAGEPSGDALGARLMSALRREAGAGVRFSGVGGEHMQAEGLASLFPMSDIALIGPLDILLHLPLVYRRVRQAVTAIVRSPADILVIIDSPEFTHAVARRVRKARPGLPIINYAPPTVWAWRPWRARRMSAYVDRVLALLPFEPEVHRRLGGPPCTYVGHPVVGRFDELRGPAGAQRRTGGPPVLVVLPGSRRSEVRRLMAPFGETVARLLHARPDLRLVLPAVDAMRAEIEDGLAGWPVRPEIVSGEAAKFAAFHAATAALACSGTVSLELALARVPMAIAYRVDPLAPALRWMLIAPSVVMPNLVLGRNVIPELLHKECTPERLEAALLPLLADSAERRAQLDAFDEVGRRMATDGVDPAVRAAREVLAVLDAAGARPATS